ncbi:MAG: hypothetical protein U1E17_17405 [Geminicoccaceae bacterium]
MRIDGAQPAPEQMAEGEERHQEAAARAGLGQQRLGGPRQGAGLGDDLAPQAPGLPPPVVGGVVAKAQIDREGDADQRERRHAGVRETESEGLRHRHHACGIEREAQDLRQDAGDDGAAPDEQQLQPARALPVDHRGIARSRLDPIGSNAPLSRRRAHSPDRR